MSVNNIKDKPFRGPICEGLYQQFGDVPCSGDGFNSDRWVNQSQAKTLKLLEMTRRAETIPANVAYRSSLLPFLAALVGQTRDRVSILDFGGALGVTFIGVASALVEKRLDYHIVESKKICEMGERVFENDARIHFHASLPEQIREVDIVHLGSSLQYVGDWKGILQKLADYRPRYFLFTDLIAGDIPTYATAQNYYGSKIPCWFFNINEIINQMTLVGFTLLFKSTYRGTYLGQEQEFPQDNFSEELRVGYTCSVLFGRETS